MNRTFTKKAPYFHITTLSKDFCLSIRDKINKRPLNEKMFLLKLDGKKMKSKLDLFNEFRTVFQFPDYFNNNWDSLEECLNDLSWMKEKGYVIVISSALEILDKNHGCDFETLIDILINSTYEWNKRKKVLFHVIFQEVNFNLVKLQQKLLSVINNDQVDLLDL